MTTKERELLDRALTTLIAALAHDEAVLHGDASVRELAELRGMWVPDAEAIVDEAERLGLLDDGLDDLDEEEFDEEDDHDDRE